MTCLISTRNKNIKVSSYKAILEGLSLDGGLYVMNKINKIDNIYKYQNLSYQALALEIMAYVFDDIDREDLKSSIKGAYDEKFKHSDITPLVKKGNSYFLELFHGPTSAFKDIALTFLPRILSIANSKYGNKKKVAILTATSGDTGKAALEGFKDVEGTLIKVLYPYKMVSTIQERQMSTTQGSNVEVIALNGNFDDCQRLIKKILSYKKCSDMTLSSANSINIGRLVPQIVYYFKAYYDLLNKKEIKKDEKVDFVVPTGNFGDILAAYIAKKMGLPINKLVCASNKNNVLTDFINTGIYDVNRVLYNTISPSIDILISSNLERLLYFLLEDTSKVTEYMEELSKNKRYKIDEETLKKLQETFIGLWADESEVQKAIKTCYEENNYLIDTHTAVAFACSFKYRSVYKKIILATASPFKFSKDVYYSLTGVEIQDNLDAMDILAKYCDLTIPDNLRRLKNYEIRFKEVIEKDDEKTLLRKLEKENV